MLPWQPMTTHQSLLAVARVRISCRGKRRTPRPLRKPPNPRRSPARPQRRPYRPRDLDDVDIDDVFAEVEEAKQAKAMVADRAKTQKGNKEVAVCGDKKVWEDDSDDDEEERVMARKKVKAMQKEVVKEKPPESKREACW